MNSMKRNVMKLWTTLVLLSLWAGVALGQEAFVRSTWVTVKPGQASAFEEHYKSVIAGAAKIHAPGTVITYSVVAGGRGGTYVFARPFQKWAELDAVKTSADILEEAYGRDEGKRIYESGTAAIESSEVWIFRTLTDLSRLAAPGSPARLIHLVRTEIEPSMASSYERYLASVKAAEDKLPQRSVVRRVSALGPGMVYSTSFLFDSWAERDGAFGNDAILAMAYGEAGAQEITEASLRCIRNRTSYILSLRPDLSLRPAAASNEDRE